MKKYLRDINEIIKGARPYPEVAPDGLGVYFLVYHGEIVYIGQSFDVGARLYAHFYSSKRFTHVYFIEVAESTYEDRRVVNTIESYYINLFRPPLNGHYPEVDAEVAEYIDKTKMIALRLKRWTPLRIVTPPR